MINKCDNCVMANCCEEFENAGCRQIQEYGEAIKSRVLDEFVSYLKANFRIGVNIIEDVVREFKEKQNV